MEKSSFFIDDYRTVPLEEELKHYNSYDEFERRFAKELLRMETRAGDYLGQLLYDHKQSSSAVSEEIGFSTGYVGNIVRGVVKDPDRDALIAICLVIKASFNEVQHLLRYMGKAPLYVRDRRDVVIWFGIMKGEDKDTVNANLKARGMKPLSGDKTK